MTLRKAAKGVCGSVIAIGIMPTLFYLIHIMPIEIVAAITALFGSIVIIIFAYLGWMIATEGE